MDTNLKFCRRTASNAVIVVMFAAIPYQAQAGSYIFGNDFPNTVTHPNGYLGPGGTLDIKVCITPGTPNANNMAKSIQNNIAVWNKQKSTTSNVRDTTLPSNSVDFESVSLHELGHCVGLGHPNLGTQSGVSGDETNLTQATSGADAVYGLNPGVDNVYGSADDVRGDDVNLHFFNTSTNNPFAENKILDATTYTRDVAALPAGDLFPANADRSVSVLSRYKAPFSEASMQQGSSVQEIQRTLGHDDVSTIRYGRSGLDGIQGSADDYTVNLIYGGVSAATDCDITVAMDAAETALGVCTVNGLFVGSNIRITTGEIYFNPNVDWYFNNASPCNESVPLTATVWKMISLPCQVGVSTSDTVQDVFGDDLGIANYFTDWAVFEYEYTDIAGGNFSGAYKALALTDSLKNGTGYWIKTNETGKSIDVQGEYNSQLDTPVLVEALAPELNNYGWNMVGNPFRFPVVWADTLVVDDNGDILSLNEADPVLGGGGATCTDTSPQPANCKVAQVAFVYNGATEGYDTLSTSTGILDKFDAAWVFAGGPDYAIRYPMSALERSTP